METPFCGLLLKVTECGRFIYTMYISRDRLEEKSYLISNDISARHVAGALAALKGVPPNRRSGHMLTHASLGRRKRASPHSPLSVCRKLPQCLLRNLMPVGFQPSRCPSSHIRIQPQTWAVAQLRNRRYGSAPHRSMPAVDLMQFEAQTSTHLTATRMRDISVVSDG